MRAHEFTATNNDIQKTTYFVVHGGVHNEQMSSPIRKISYEWIHQYLNRFSLYWEVYKKRLPETLKPW